MSNRITTVNPATGEQLESYQKLDLAQTTQIIEDSHDAFLKWRHVSLKDRAEAVKAIGKALHEHKEAFADLMVKEMGKLPAHAREEIDLCVGICDYTAEQGPQNLAENAAYPRQPPTHTLRYPDCAHS